MPLLPWYINPKFSLGDVSKYALGHDIPGSLNRLLIYIIRKYPTLQGQWPKAQTTTPSSAIDVDKYESCVTYMGHRTLYLKLSGVKFLTDPVFARRLLYGGFGVKRIDNALCKYWEMPSTDFLLFSNNSFDCIDHWTLIGIRDTGRAIVIGGKNLTKYIAPHFHQYTYTLKWFEEVDLGAVKVTFVPSKSQTKRKLLSCGIDLNLMLWGGFIITDGNKRIFYAGKTAYSEHFKEIRNHIGDVDLDLAILPIGPFFKQKRDMTPEEAVQAHFDLRAKKSLLVAHDTFPLGIEAYGELKSRLVAEVQRLDPQGSNGLREQFVFLEHRETMPL
ncbi:bifunctional Metallo-beta-lactamase/Ribonuclease Z-Hydroxyacylglutathione hydrolase-like [Babesia duncani]|uniref:Bifunctional Metallo-beta-lactamase/Ribonuclease Z-Hydroxyacylglutathione hydrolase-like n=1 Tax=Babesia duncani TaxID=323732 RepID=A0AAD9UPR6_9APIC|nr:bifunctional Metallo-beta-lactamase/Ribonuclease Z-Hydroxyacylglutathione hydrolase-like [Babesia duncani]